MHDSGLHYYEPPKKNAVFLNTVSKNKEGFSKRKIKIAVKDRDIQNTLGFTTVNKLKWIIRSNHFHDFPVEAEDVENSETIWGQDVPYLKYSTIRKNPVLVTEDVIIFPKEFLKISKDVFRTMDIFL